MTNPETRNPKPRERDSIIQSLSAGVVPRHGLRHLQVGRIDETRELVKDMERIVNGGSAIRFIIGEYGSGKTFFMNLIRRIALEKGLVVMSADLAPDRRLYATGGQARGLYAEMARNLSTRSKTDGGALGSVVERFMSTAQGEAENRGISTDRVIKEKLQHFRELTGGFEFARVIGYCWEGHETGNIELKNSALRWLRGEYATRTDARRELPGIRTIVDDAGVYDQLKLMAAFVVESGYKGLLVGMDEMVNVYKLTSSQARKANYEQILRIVNDVLQGSAENLGFLMGGTPEFLMNTRRGLYSYEALQSRLAENTFARDGLVDFSGPVMRLQGLTPEDMFVLLQNIRGIMQEDDVALSDDALQAFMKHCSERIGEAYFQTPRNTVTAFVQFISVLQQNPDTKWTSLIDKIEIADDQGDDMSDIDEAIGRDSSGNGEPSQQDGFSRNDDDLVEFSL